MKKIVALMTLMILFAAFSVDAMGMQDRHLRPRHHHHHGNTGSGNNNSGSVGAPLDGGLLTVLGAAGIAYVASRKKKKASGE